MVRTTSPGLFFWWPGWRKGRRKGLKIPREKSHVGSIPTPGTWFSAGLWASSMGWQHTYSSSRNVRITPGVGQARLYPTEWNLQMGTAPT